jgi:hypothetical protein
MPTFASISAIFAPALARRSTSLVNVHVEGPSDAHSQVIGDSDVLQPPEVSLGLIAQRRQKKNEHHVGFVDPILSAGPTAIIEAQETTNHPYVDAFGNPSTTAERNNHLQVPSANPAVKKSAQDSGEPPKAYHTDAWKVEPHGEGPVTPGLHNLNSPFYEKSDHDEEAPISHDASGPTVGAATSRATSYTHELRSRPPKTFVQTLRPWNGRLRKDKWLRAAFRPFILFAYPAILWSALVYSLSIGWLIVISESVADIYRSSHTYNFTALQAGLVYLSPFIGGVIGTAVAGKVSDIMILFMSRRNGGIYEPEFRLIMALPVTVSTCIGLMGYGWSAAERDAWIVPTMFFGVISFGCSLGSTTAITFAVDSYRQYAGEALVTLNFSKSGFPAPFLSRTWISVEGS